MLKGLWNRIKDQRDCCYNLRIVPLCSVTYRKQSFSWMQRGGDDSLYLLKAPLMWRPWIDSVMCSFWVSCVWRLQRRFLLCHYIVKNISAHDVNDWDWITSLFHKWMHLNRCSHWIHFITQYHLCWHHSLLIALFHKTRTCSQGFQKADYVWRVTLKISSLEQWGSENC